MINIQTADETALTNQVKELINFSFKISIDNIGGRLIFDTSKLWQDSENQVDFYSFVSINKKCIAKLFGAYKTINGETVTVTKKIQFNEDAGILIKTI